MYHKRQKFWGWKVSRFCWVHQVCGEKFRDFFDHHLHNYIHGFPALQNSYEHFNESFMFLTWILLKTVISILGNGREYITDICVCADFTLSGWLSCHRRRKATVEVCPRWNRSQTASFLASSASYFLISWQKPSRWFATTVEYSLKYFMVSNFQRSISLAGKTFTVY